MLGGVAVLNLSTYPGGKKKTWRGNFDGSCCISTLKCFKIDRCASSECVARFELVHLLFFINFNLNTELCVLLNCNPEISNAFSDTIC